MIASEDGGFGGESLADTSVPVVMDDSIEFRVESTDASEVGLDDIDRRDLFRTDGSCDLNERGIMGDGHGRSGEVKRR